MKPIILTAGGDYYDLLNTKNSVISIETIAHALSNLCRFTGHTSEFYSVAQHCYHASFLVPAEYAMETLLHDASEALVGDVATPLKRQLPNYEKIESDVQAAIAEQFNLTLPFSTYTHRADQIMLATEKRDLMPPTYDDWFAGTDIVPLPQRICPCPPNVAKRMFLERYYYLVALDELADEVAA